MRIDTKFHAFADTPYFGFWSATLNVRFGSIGFGNLELTKKNSAKLARLAGRIFSPVHMGKFSPVTQMKKARKVDWAVLTAYHLSKKSAQWPLCLRRCQRLRSISSATLR